ncbi:MAG: RluA family pseudouridine synthase [Henriciella sp.]|nr:RluA family pseudouridine synthase [Henriciella sp.]
MRNRPIPTLSDADKAYVQALVCFEDEVLLAFNKPSGLPVQTRGSHGRHLDGLLWAFARSNGKRPRLVHQLDAGTSGVIIAAKTKPAAAFLSQCFETRQVNKRYLAIIHGDLPNADSGHIDLALQRSGRGVTVSNASDAKPAQTSWTRLERLSGNAALLEVRPLTGRLHQIRAHLSAIGCPIDGDTLYGGAEAPRLMLHAAGLSLPHPDGSTLELEAPVPEDFRNWQSGLTAGAG